MVEQHPSYRQVARRRGPGLEKLLGELEAEVMTIIWAMDGSFVVRDVLIQLNRQRRPEVAYTTVLTIMSRLTAKGLLERRLVGKTHQYWVAKSRDGFLRTESGRIVEDLVTAFSEATIAGFVDALGRVDPHRLKDLRGYLAKQPQPE
ncbi:MAG TPA: BlaI/MecI/CopY family transcriptional regulator [Dehalococcoidia bacterium]|nr:BlaI/MecI/CopY family transcriptional regulator [Dehalococcoidia bacterium]